MAVLFYQENVTESISFFSTRIAGVSDWASVTRRNSTSNRIKTRKSFFATHRVLSRHSVSRTTGAIRALEILQMISAWTPIAQKNGDMLCIIQIVWIPSRAGNSSPWKSYSFILSEPPAGIIWQIWYILYDVKAVALCTLTRFRRKNIIFCSYKTKENYVTSRCLQTDITCLWNKCKL